MSSKRKRTKGHTTGGAGSPRTPLPGSPARRPDSRSRQPHRRWFIALALLGPFLLLGVLELGLRLAGFGYPTGFFLRMRLNDRPVWIENARFGWRFFPRRLARAPRPIVLPVDKAPGTCRIFVLGESAAMGDPEPAYGLPRVLATLLRGRFPGRQFEVVNVAMTAINSNVILPIARDCVRRQGDVWVIYMGNNEVVGPFGAGTIFSAHLRSRTLLQASLALKRTRVGQLLAAGLAALGKSQSLPPMWEGMEMFLQQQVPEDDPRLEAVYKHFELNLRDILSAARRCGAKVVISTVVSNLKDCAPFGSRHRPDLSDSDLAAWDKSYQTGSRQAAEGNFGAALTTLQRAEQIDPTYANLEFLLAECDRATSRFDEARQRFVQARDLDTLRFRCDSRLNQIIRQVAADRADEGIYLLDAARDFARPNISPHGLTGGEFLVDHVHFGFEGNYLLAGLIANEIAKALPLAEPVPKRSWPTMTDCAEALALTGWDRYQMVRTMLARLAKPPFDHQLNHAATLKALETQLQSPQWQAFVRTNAFPTWRTIYARALGAAPGDWLLHAQLAKLLENFNETPDAISEWRRVTTLVPQYAIAHYQLARLLNRGPDRSEAKQQALEALRWWPDFPQALNTLGIVLAHDEQFDGACRQFARALQLDPYLFNAQINWAMTLAASGQAAEALTHYSNAVSLEPESPDLHFRLGLALERQANRSDASAQFRETLRLDPAHRGAREALARVEGLLSNAPASASSTVIDQPPLDR